MQLIGKILLFFCEAFGNYGWSILAFGLIVKLIMLPFQMKSKKGMMRMSMLAPRQKELEKKYRGNQQKYSEEVAKLYKEAKVNPMSGCLWSLLPFPIIIILYRAVRSPLTLMMSLAQGEVDALTKLLTDLGYYVASAGRNASYYAELPVAHALHDHFAEIVSNPAVSGFADKLRDINFNFFGLNLSETPRLMFWTDGFTWAAFVLFLIPFLSAGLSILQNKVTMMSQPSQDPQAAQSMKTMNLLMPLMSLWICFSMPALMGVYWVEQSVLAMIQEPLLTKLYQRKINAEMADFLEEEKRREEELERKRAETERKRAEGTTQINASTSKKRLAAQERNAQDQRLAAQRAANRAARGIVEEIPPSQVGNRRYARGRAYDPDRYAEEVGLTGEIPQLAESGAAQVKENKE